MGRWGECGVGGGGSGQRLRDDGGPGDTEATEPLQEQCHSSCGHESLVWAQKKNRT